MAKRKQPPPRPPRTMLSSSHYLRIDTVEELHTVATLLNGFKQTPSKLIHEFNLGLPDRVPTELDSCAKLAKLTCPKASAIYLLQRGVPKVGDHKVMQSGKRDIQIGCWIVSKAQAESFLTAIGYYGGRKPRSGKPFLVADDHYAQVDGDQVQFGYLEDRDRLSGEDSYSITDLYKVADIMKARGWIKAK